jgi:hypothetical protein
MKLNSATVFRGKAFGKRLGLINSSGWIPHGRKLVAL